jgi:type IV secretion system protein VirB9
MKRVLAVCSSVVWLAFAASTTAAGADQDSRLRTVVFDEGRVVPVNVQEGFAVQIVLAGNEQIEAAGTGANSHCDDAAAKWCVVARRGEHDVYVNVHPGATRTNLFVQTDRHNYSFDLNVVPASAPGHNRYVYRVKFSYPDDILKQAMAVESARLAAQQAERERTLLAERLAQAPVARNWNYTMQVMPGGDGIAPSMMYDDGRFTYLRFPNNREVPSIYMVADDGSESLVQWHVDNDVMVVHRVAKRFVLRNGTSVVGLWNESYDMDGVPPHEGVTVPGLRRVINEHPAVQQGSLSGVSALNTRPITALPEDAATATTHAGAGVHSMAEPVTPTIRTPMLRPADTALPAVRTPDSDN